MGWTNIDVLRVGRHTLAYGGPKVVEWFAAPDCLVQWHQAETSIRGEFLRADSCPGGLVTDSPQTRKGNPKHTHTNILFSWPG